MNDRRVFILLAYFLCLASIGFMLGLIIDVIARIFPL